MCVQKSGALIFYYICASRPRLSLFLECQRVIFRKDHPFRCVDDDEFYKFPDVLLFLSFIARDRQPRPFSLLRPVF